jgi:hypothetical protein
MDIATNSGALEDMYEGREEEETSVMHKELASFVLSHVKKSMRKLVTTMHR